MKIGVPREIKNSENRVALTDVGVNELTRDGHEVFVERGAGVGSGITDEHYEQAGGILIDSPDDLWADVEMVVKVKEPVNEELSRMRRGQILFTFLHLAASAECTRAVLDSGTTAIAYETVHRDGALPLLAPMSQIAGRIAPMAGAYHLTQAQGGSGILLSGATGTRRASVVVIGGGAAGESAAVVAAGMGANVSVIDVNLTRLAHLEHTHQQRFATLASSAMTIGSAVADADLVIGSVLIPGAAAPKLVTQDMVAAMRPGSVLVDIAIDQGGCFEGSRPTTHDNPTYPVHDALYYCVANMPGAVPQTSTAALSQATLPYLRRVAGRGWREALRADEGLAEGLNAHDGVLTQRGVFDAVAEELQLNEQSHLRTIDEVLAH